MTSKYLLDQQRVMFKDNWDDELEEWGGDWDEKECREIITFKKEKDMFCYLDIKIMMGRGGAKHYYHNLKNQNKEDRASMFRDIIEFAIDNIRDFDAQNRQREREEKAHAERQRLKNLAQQPEFKCEDCPVCWEKLGERVVPICGHPICIGCRSKVNKCPTCRNPF